MTMPAQRPHRSVQEVATPPEFLQAVRERFGEIWLDIAASNDNAVVAHYHGPGSPFPDALAHDCSWVSRGLSWLNPPYANIMPWAAKAAAQTEWGARIAMLVPASVGSNWFNACVRPFAYVLELSPRLTFVGHASAYPKDLLLCIYTPEKFLGREAWHWRRAPVAANDNADGVDPRQMQLPIIEGAA